VYLINARSEVRFREQAGKHVLTVFEPKLDAMITLQAQIIAYIDDFKLMMIVTLAAIPLLIAFRKAPGNGGENHALVAE
jgi:hypothetical protein